MIIQICVGSSCHLKGTEKLIQMFQNAVKQYDLDREVTLAGSFCTSRCNRLGVTVIVDDEVYTGITPEKFEEFFADKVLKPLKKGRA